MYNVISFWNGYSYITRAHLDWCPESMQEGNEQRLDDRLREHPPDVPAPLSLAPVSSQGLHMTGQQRTVLDLNNCFYATYTNNILSFLSAANLILKFTFP